MTGIDVYALSEAEAADYKIGITFEAIDAVGETGYEAAWESFLSGGVV